jgi:hypothetical protein
LEKLLKNNYMFYYYDRVRILHQHEKTTNTLSHSERQKLISIMKSDLYYFNKYRNYNKLECFIAALGKLMYILIYRPLIAKVKKILSNI